jgi:hypothetical protein
MRCTIPHCQSGACGRSIFPFPRGLIGAPQHGIAWKWFRLVAQRRRACIINKREIVIARPEYPFRNPPGNFLRCDKARGHIIPSLQNHLYTEHH